MSNIKIYDTERGYRFIVPFLRKKGIEIDVKKDIVLGDTLSGLIKLMDEMQRQTADNVFMRDIKALLFGLPGSGKSYTAAEIITGLVNVEKTEAPILLIDSATVIWKNFVNTYRNKNNVKFMSIDKWGQVIQEFDSILHPRVRNHNYNIIITGRLGHVYKDEVDEKTGKRRMEVVDSKVKLSSEIAHEPDIIIEMEQLKSRENGKVKIVNQAIILKDRSDCIQGQSCDFPDWQFFKPVWDYLNLEVPETPETDKSDDGDIIPQDDYDHEGARQKKIQLQRNEALLDQVASGTGKGVKAFRLALMNQAYMGETSELAISRMNYEQLLDANGRLTGLVEVIKKIYRGETKVYPLEKVVIAARNKYLETTNLGEVGLEKLQEYLDHMIEKAMEMKKKEKEKAA